MRTNEKRSQKPGARSQDGRRAAVIVAVLAGVMGLAAGSVWGQHAPEARGSLDAVKVLTPSSQPAATPDIGGTPMPQAGTMPAGHPGMGEGQSVEDLIPGHPKSKGATAGALRVVFTQGTKDGSSLEKDAVTVALMSEGKVLHAYKSQVEKGLVELHDLPLDVSFQPVVSVVHGGVEQQMAGPPMHKYQPAVELDMRVYDVTAEKPAWNIGLRHMTVQPAMLNGELGVRVAEMFGGYSPLDRAWSGELVAGSKEKRILAIALPEGAKDVIFGHGMLEAGAHVENGYVVRGGAMLPDSSEYIYGYFVAAKAGRVRLSFTVPVDTTLFALYVPGDVKVEEMTGLELAKAGGALGDLGRQLLKAKGVKAGTVATVEISGIKEPAKAVEAKPVTPGTEIHLPGSPAGNTELKK